MSHQRRRCVIALGHAALPMMLPRIIVTIRSGSRDWRDRWHKLVKRLGLIAEAVHERGWETDLDVAGAPEALAELTGGAHKVVVRWEYAVSGPNPDLVRAAGTGESKPCRVTERPRYFLRADDAAPFGIERCRTD